MLTQEVEEPAPMAQDLVEVREVAFQNRREGPRGIAVADELDGCLLVLCTVHRIRPGQLP
jgi:hypothetical protein